jgi:ribosomal protein L11 methyltransferase
MNYVEVTFTIYPLSTGTEILIALLSEIGYESFQETDKGVHAYVPEKLFSVKKINHLLGMISDEFKTSFHFNIIPEQNWNEVWESNYNPVLVKGKVFVRAPFHKKNEESKYEIIIEPKMSFGTAHHETTGMMIELMLDEQMNGKKVLDMGCGTGILAILSGMLGASEIMAVDIDQWAVDNALENIKRNNCHHISVHSGDIKMVTGMHFDYILANINKNVLMKDIGAMAKCLNPKGTLLLSGFYDTDYEQISHEAVKKSLSPVHQISKNEWMAAKFVKL